MILKSSKGFTLIEVMVVIGVVGIIAMTLATLTSSMVSAQRRIEAKQDLFILGNDFYNRTLNSDHCRALFAQSGNFNPSVASSPEGQSLPRVDLPNETLRPGENLRNYQLNVTSLIFREAQEIGPQLYSAKLFGRFEVPHMGPGSSLALREKALSTLRLSLGPAGEIQSCVGQMSLSDLSTETLTQICGLMGGNLNTETGRCIPSYAGNSCPSGQMVVGFSIDGTPLCSVVSGGSVAALPGAAGATGATGASGAAGSNGGASLWGGASNVAIASSSAVNNGGGSATSTANNNAVQTASGGGSVAGKGSGSNIAGAASSAVNNGPGQANSQAVNSAIQSAGSNK